MPARNSAVVKPGEEIADIPKDVLLGLYTYLVKTRLLDERFRKLFRQGRFAGTYFSAVGQEATTVCPTYGLRDDDIIAPSHREIGAAVAKGIPLIEIVAQVYARKNSPDKGKTHPCHYGSRRKGVITPASTIASQTIIGTGCAMGFRMLKKDNVVIAFFGEGATARGGWHEALNYAGIYKLPIIYVCQNNLWAESIPASLSGAIQFFSDRAKAYGFPGITVDGNDMVEMYKISQEAIQHARAGEGPTLIEAMTYRWYGHSEIDPANYRSPEELETWKKRDPILRAENYLRKAGLLDDTKRESIHEHCNHEIDEAVRACENEEYAEPEEAYLDVYSEKFPVRRDEY